MNLRQLEVYYLVVKKKSFTRAAEELNVTQPAVTIQVKICVRREIINSVIGISLIGQYAIGIVCVHLGGFPEVVPCIWTTPCHHDSFHNFVARNIGSRLKDLDAVDRTDRFALRPIARRMLD